MSLLELFIAAEKVNPWIILGIFWDDTWIIPRLFMDYAHEISMDNPLIIPRKSLDFPRTIPRISLVYLWNIPGFSPDYTFIILEFI